MHAPFTATTAFFLASAALALAAGCGDDTTASGGSGGTGGAGGTGAGGSAQGGSAQGGGGGEPACETAAPTHGGSCEGDLACDYEVTPAGCAEAQAFTATCESGSWNAPVPASCGALDNPTCDPAGSFTLTYSNWDPMEVLGSPASFEVLDVDGALFTTGLVGSFSEDGCTFTGGFGDEDCFEMDGEEFCELDDWAFTLDFSQIPATGTVDYECTGECGLTATADVTAG